MPKAMSGGGKTTAEPGNAERRVLYCLIPPDLAAQLHEPLYRHFRDDPGVEVVVERRSAERRSGTDRRLRKGKPPTAAERRRLRSTTGRRIGERRASLIPAAAPQLPRRARRYAEQLRIVERVVPSSERTEDRDTARLVDRIQAGDRDAFGTIYTRYFDRVYTYVRAIVARRQDAEDVTQEAFAKMLEGIAKYERRDQPFRAWMFTVVRNAAIDYLEKQGRIDLLEPDELERAREKKSEPVAAPELGALNWITDQDLLVFVERLPLAQRQVLVLRYVFDMRTSEIARVLGRTRTNVSTLQYRALEFLEERLTAVGRYPAGKAAKRGANKMKAWGTPANVIRARRFALWD